MPQKEEVGCCALVLKLDFAKAFDIVNWDVQSDDGQGFQ